MVAAAGAGAKYVLRYELPVSCSTVLVHTKRQKSAIYIFDDSTRKSTAQRGQVRAGARW